MAKPIGKEYAIFITCLLYLTIGPLFAILRTATVAFEVGLNSFINPNLSQLGLLVFSIIFFAVTLYFSLKPGRILDWVGTYLTSLFLVLLMIVIIVAFVKPMGNASLYDPLDNYATQPFITGLFEGYNTMDALVSLAFSIIIISNIEKLGIKESKQITLETCKSGMFVY